MRWLLTSSLSAPPATDTPLSAAVISHLDYRSHLLGAASTSSYSLLPPCPQVLTSKCCADYIASKLPAKFNSNPQPGVGNLPGEALSVQVSAFTVLVCFTLAPLHRSHPLRNSSAPQNRSHPSRFSSEAPSTMKLAQSAFLYPPRVLTCKIISFILLRSR